MAVMDLMNFETKNGNEQTETLQKAFALACRLLGDIAECPAAMVGTDWPECEGKAECLGDHNAHFCWQRFVLEVIENKSVCKVCGCSDLNACSGGCSWVGKNLCSTCAAAQKHKREA